MPDLPSDITPEAYNQAVRDYLKNSNVPAPTPKSGSAFSENAPALLGMLGLGAGKALAAAKPILGGIIGPVAKNWNRAKERQAWQMLKEGTHTPEDIFRNTNLFKGYRGGFRQYIPDVGLKVKNLPKDRSSLSVQDVVDWPEMFENYPKVADMPVTLSGQGKPGEGSYSHYNNRIELHGPVGDRLSWPQLKTLSHEGGHAVAGIEMWPGGTNPEHMISIAKDRAAERARLGPTAFADAYPNTEKLFRRFGTVPEKVGYKMYKLDPGETEARLNAALLARLKGKPLSTWEDDKFIYPTSEASELFRKSGLDLQRGASGELSLRDFKANTMVDPEALPSDLNETWNYLVAGGRFGSSPVGRIEGYGTPSSKFQGVGKEYPWKWEDHPRALQNDYDTNP